MRPGQRVPMSGTDPGLEGNNGWRKVSKYSVVVAFRKLGDLVPRTAGLGQAVKQRVPDPPRPVAVVRQAFAKK